MNHPSDQAGAPDSAKRGASAPHLAQAVAVVMAGGFGTRVQHLLPGIPKPMAPVAGRPFLEWVLRYLARQGVPQAVLATGYLSDVIENHFAPQPVPGITARTIPEPTPLGTGGGFLHAARAAADQPALWVVMNGDSLVLADLEPALEPLRDPDVAGVLLGCPVPDAARYGTLAIGPDRDLVRFAEKRPGQGIINAGVYLLRHSLLRLFPQPGPLSFEKEIFPQCIALGLKLKVVAVDAPFLDIGTPESLREAEAFVSRHPAAFEAP
jgi:D-glycero-alpha-D-manno-heptose 1-phosphate guanylyltransferase